MGWLIDLLRRLFGLGGPDEPPEPPMPPDGPPGPLPVPVPFQAVEGRVTLEIRGLDRIPVSPQRDDFVIFVLTWEKSGADSTVPVLGVHYRGVPDGQRGFTMRWSPNIHHDQQVYRQFGESRPELFYGDGVNYHNRVKAGDGIWTIVWSRNQIHVTSPVGGVLSLSAKMPGSIGFGRLVTELWVRSVNRYHLWKGFEATQHGVTVKLLSWTGKQGELVRLE